MEETKNIQRGMKETMKRRRKCATSHRIHVSAEAMPPSSWYSNFIFLQNFYKSPTRLHDGTQITQTTTATMSSTDGHWTLPEPN